jgi:hypothetical protein
MTPYRIISHQIKSHHFTPWHTITSHKLEKVLQSPHVLRMSYEVVPPASGMEMQSPVFTTPWHLELYMEL